MNVRNQQLGDGSETSRALDPFASPASTEPALPDSAWSLALRLYCWLWGFAGLTAVGAMYLVTLAGLLQIFRNFMFPRFAEIAAGVGIVLSLIAGWFIGCAQGKRHSERLASRIQAARERRAELLADMAARWPATMGKTGKPVERS